MFSLGGPSGTKHVTYPHGIGQVPSPGGTQGRLFDEGVLGVKVQGGDLIVQVAGGLNPQTGYYYDGWDTWFGQGDVFLTVADSSGTSNFALLSAWAKDIAGSYRRLGVLDRNPYDGVYNDRNLNNDPYEIARQFHMGLEGQLVSLSTDSDVALTGGRGSYYPGYHGNGLPHGLDYRVFAQGGSSVGDAGLVAGTVSDGQQWFLQTWTVPLDWLSTDQSFTVGLHSAVSCSNDQIGLTTQVVPVPAALILGLAGFGTVGLVGKIGRRRGTSGQRNA